MDPHDNDMSGGKRIVYYREDKVEQQQEKMDSYIVTWIIINLYLKKNLIYFMILTFQSLILE